MLQATRDVLRNASYENLFTTAITDVNLQEKKKGVWKRLSAFGEQLIDFKAKTESIVSTPAVKALYGMYLSEACEKISSCLLQVGIIKVGSKPLFSNLESFEHLCNRCYEELKKINSNTLDSETKLSEFRNVLNIFNKRNQELSAKQEDQEITVIAKAEKEIERLRAKITLYKRLPYPDEDLLSAFAYRVRNQFTDYELKNELNKNLQKEESRQARYIKLEKAYTAACLKHEEVKNLIIQLEITLPLVGVTKSHERLQTGVETMFSCVQKVSAGTFAEGFNVSPDAKKRDLAPHFAAIETTRNELKNFHGIHGSLSKTNQDNAKNREVVLVQLKKVSQAINKADSTINSNGTILNVLSKQEKDVYLKNGKETSASVHSNYAMEDRVRLSYLNDQHIALRASLIKIRNKIFEDWNTSCFKLNSINNMLTRFENLINITSKCGEYSVRFEEILYLRDIRKHEKKRTTHEKVFKDNKNQFSGLSDAITKCSVEFFYTPPTSNNDGLKLQMSYLATPNQKVNEKQLSLNYQYEQVTKIADRLDVLNRPAIAWDAEKVGLVWITPETKATTLNQLTKQRNGFAEALKNDDNKIKEDYEIMLKRCSTAVWELNAMGKTLATATSDYDDNFPKAYPYKNETGQAMVEIGGVVAGGFSNLASGAIGMLMSVTQSEKAPEPQRAPHKKIYSPFDPEHKIKH